MSINFLQTPTDSSKTVAGLKIFWKKVLPIILYRENHFDNIWKTGTEEEVFLELIFCLFTPQSKAISCWSAVNDLVSKNMMLYSNEKDIAEVINKVRFRNNKAHYVIEARKLFIIDGKIKIKKELKSFKDLYGIYKLRKWLIKNVKGIGCKEAGHFLRNVGIGKSFAILDRHILKNLRFYDVIKEIPKVIDTKTYLEIEKKMQNFAKNIKIPMSHLDMLFWCKKTGGIFK